MEAAATSAAVRSFHSTLLVATRTASRQHGTRLTWGQGALIDASNPRYANPLVDWRQKAGAFASRYPQSRLVHSQSPTAQDAETSRAGSVPGQGNGSARSEHDEGAEDRRPRPSRFWRTVRFVAWLPVVISVSHLGSIGNVTGASMSPTLNATGTGSDIILLNRYAMLTSHLQIGDVVLLKSPNDPNMLLTKRILAMPGDIVSVHVPEDERASSSSSGSRATWWPSSRSVSSSNGKAPVARIRIPPYHIWVEGDASAYDMEVSRSLAGQSNRNGAHPRSRDSRHFGPIPLGLVTARVDMVLWPPSRFGPLPPRPDFDAQRLESLRKVRQQREKFGLKGYGRRSHPDDSVLSPYTDWEWASNHLKGSVGAARQQQQQQRQQRSQSGAAPGDVSGQDKAEANSLSRVFFWRQSPSSTDPAPGEEIDTDSSTRASKRTRRRGSRRKGAEDTEEEGDEFDVVWRQRLNAMSRGGQLGSNLNRNET